MPRLNLNFTHSVDDLVELLHAVRPVWAVKSELIEIRLPEFDGHAYQHPEARELIIRLVDAANRVGLSPDLFDAPSALILATCLCQDGAIPGFEIVEADGRLSVVPMTRPQDATLQ